MAGSATASHAAGEEGQQTRARRRRKKPRPGALAHQDAMNQFIKDTHKDQNPPRSSAPAADYQQAKAGSK